MRILILSMLLILISNSIRSQAAGLPEVQLLEHPAIITQEFIYEINNAPTPECHASTVAVADNTVIAAWFGGTKEKNKDVGIWMSRKTGTSWSAPLEVVNGVQEDGTRYPCWNPVLYKPKGQPLFLFYKVGPSPGEWWGMYMTSTDGGIKLGNTYEVGCRNFRTDKKSTNTVVGWYNIISFKHRECY